MVQCEANCFTGGNRCSRNAELPRTRPRLCRQHYKMKNPSERKVIRDREMLALRELRDAVGYYLHDTVRGETYEKLWSAYNKAKEAADAK